MKESRPDFREIKSFEEFNRYYWYREELSRICKSLELEYKSTKQELNHIIEQYFKGNRVEKSVRKVNKNKIEAITLNTSLLECGFSFNQKFREYFSAVTGIYPFKFNADMATAWRKVKAENDLNFTIQDMLKVYYGESDYAKYDNSACQWNQFLKDFCLDEASNYYPDKLKVAAILWKKVRDSKNEKVYSSKLLNEYNSNKEGSAIKPLKTSGADIEQRTNRMGDTVLSPKECVECYSNDPRITPLLHPLDCLKNHTQYICGTCGRCICIQHDSKRKLQRWNFPFNSLAIAKLYLRTADFTRKKSCGIYELHSKNGRVSYKIFADIEELQLYLKKNQEKTCKSMQPVFTVAIYREYENTQVRKLNYNEIQKYMSER